MKDIKKTIHALNIILYVDIFQQNKNKNPLDNELVVECQPSYNLEETNADGY